MAQKLFLPESMYKIDSKMNHRKLKAAFRKQNGVIGRIIRLNAKDKSFVVDLGGNFIGTMPFEFSTIYPIYKDNEKFSYGFISLVGKTIRAKIIKYDKDNIVLSRKAIMLEALEFLKQTSEIKFAAITGFSRLSTFLDIGCGIMGKSKTYDYSTIIFKHAEDVGFKKGDIIQGKIVNFLPELNSFDISVVDTLQDPESIYNVDDIVVCKVFASVGDNMGYYVLVDKKYNGIVDCPLYKLEYGDEVSAYVNKITPNGIRLKAIEKLL